MTGIMAGTAISSLAVIVSISPDFQTVGNGTTASRNFVESITVLHGTASSYVWSLTSPVGTWTIIGGQGTSSCTAQVSSAAIGPDYTVTLNCAVTVNGQVHNISASLEYIRIS